MWFLTSSIILRVLDKILCTILVELQSMQRLRHHFSSHVGIKLRRCSSTCIPPITLVRAGSVFCLGTAAGVFGSLVGMGGAFVVLPVLSGPLALPVHKAIGTSMGAVLGTCIGGVISFSTKELPLENKIETHHLDTIFGSVPLVSGDVNILASGFIILSAAMFAVIGARCSKHMHDRTIKLAQGIFMMCVAPSIMVRDYLKDNANSTTRDMHDDPSFEKTLGVNNIVTPYYVGRLLSIGVGAGLPACLLTLTVSDLVVYGCMYQDFLLVSLVWVEVQSLFHVW